MAPSRPPLGALSENHLPSLKAHLSTNSKLDASTTTHNASQFRLPPLNPAALSTICNPVPNSSSTLNASNSRKRKAPTPELASATSPDINDISDDDERLDEHRWDCGQIRSKINLFIKSGEMKVGEFQRALNVTSRGYTTFMKQMGRDKGSGSDTYHAAHRFFMKRELLGIKNKRKPTGTTKKAKADNEAKYDVSGITLEGEDKVAVEVYETCDTIRKMIRKFMKESGMTQAAFCREISKTFPVGLDKCLQGRSLTSFLAKSGPAQGNSSEIFYAAYVFFEKLRVRDGKPKTEFRETMEDIWKKDGGFDRMVRSKGLWVTSHRQPYVNVDEYGKEDIFF
ncbi:hypothetical protein BJY04DRAFT_56378 [Aspergillus karnatakaensis]|uniref:uncharacterized protein n=1 Tax=Aspergillus karnatakaensis TaxID=1810916 RepID=UPI003CCE2197